LVLGEEAEELRVSVGESQEAHGPTIARSWRTTASTGPGEDSSKADRDPAQSATSAPVMSPASCARRLSSAARRRGNRKCLPAGANRTATPETDMPSSTACESSMGRYASPSVAVQRVLRREGNSERLLFVIVSDSWSSAARYASAMF